MSSTYFHNFTELSWLAEATIPVTGDCAKAEIIFSCAGIVMLLFSAMFHNSKDCHQWFEKTAISNISSAY
jgi:hypothetical protein